MSDQSEEFRRQLLIAQEISPSLRDSYQKELETMLQPPLTARAGLVGTVLLIGLLVTVALIVRADFFFHVRGLSLVAHVALAAGLLWACFMILRDLRKRKHTQKSVYSIAMVLTWAAGTMTVIALLLGLRHSSDPKSLFDAFYVFVFYFACAVWGLEGRIATAELAAREQSLRIEYRLADLAERLQK
jgi:drug/metabolite transporter (DMT)-like permease